MKAAVIAAVLTIATLLAAGAELPKWEREPETYRGVPFGASIATARQKVTGLACHDDKDAGTICASIFDLTPQLKGVRDAWLFVDGKFTGAAMLFPVNADLDFTEVLIERYGRPTTPDYTTSTVWVWRGDHLIASCDLQERTFTLATPAFSDRMGRAMQQQKKDAASKF